MEYFFKLFYSRGASAHSPELEHGSLGIGVLSSRPIVPSSIQPESQLLPAHLKCGMWASLALATVFVAGAKFYFDHQVSLFFEIFVITCCY